MNISRILLDKFRSRGMPEEVCVLAVAHWLANRTREQQRRTHMNERRQPHPTDECEDCRL